MIWYSAACVFSASCSAASTSRSTLDVVRELDLIRQRAHGGSESLVAQDDGLEVEGEVAQLTDRRAVPLERAADDLLRLLAATLLDRVQACVEHQRDTRERLHGAVVQLVGKTPPLVLLRSQQLIR